MVTVAKKSYQRLGFVLRNLEIPSAFCKTLSIQLHLSKLETDTAGNLMYETMPSEIIHSYASPENTQQFFASCLTVGYRDN